MQDALLWAWAALCAYPRDQLPWLYQRGHPGEVTEAVLAQGLTASRVGCAACRGLRRYHHGVMEHCHYALGAWSSDWRAGETHWYRSSRDAECRMHAWRPSLKQMPGATMAGSRSEAGADAGGCQLQAAVRPATWDRSWLGFPAPPAAAGGVHWMCVGWRGPARPLHCVLGALLRQEINVGSIHELCDRNAKGSHQGVYLLNACFETLTV